MPALKSCFATCVGLPRVARIRPSGGVQSDVYNQNDNPINPYSQFSDFALNFHNFHSLVMAYLDLNNRNSERKSAGMHWASLQGLAPACDEQRRGRRRVRLQGPHRPGGATGDQGTSEAPLLSPQSKPPMALQPSKPLHSGRDLKTPSWSRRSHAGRRPSRTPSSVSTRPPCLGTDLGLCRCKQYVNIGCVFICVLHSNHGPLRSWSCRMKVRQEYCFLSLVLRTLH